MCRVSEGETEAANGEASGRSSVDRGEEGAPLLRFVHLNLLPDPNDDDVSLHVACGGSVAVMATRSARQDAYSTGLGKRVVPRLRELAGSQEAGYMSVRFTHLFHVIFRTRSVRQFSLGCTTICHMHYYYRKVER